MVSALNRGTYFGDYMNVREELFNLQDLKYKQFHSKIVPNIGPERIIGVRIPELRKLGKSLTDDDFAWDYYEEVMLHGFYIGYAKLDFEHRLILLNEFVPCIDNWAVCDCVCSTLKFIKKYKADFFEYLKKYMYSDKEYEMRFAIVCLMDYYIDDDYVNLVLDYLKCIKSDYYYVNMAVAWALSVVFVKYESKAMPLLESGVLTAEIHNMTISKIRDSLRVDRETKEYLKALKK